MRLDERSHVLIAYLTESEIHSEQLGAQLNELADTVPAGKRLALDFSAVQSMSPKVIDVLIAFDESCRILNVALTVRRMPPAAMERFQDAGFQHILEIADGRKDRWWRAGTDWLGRCG